MNKLISHFTFITTTLNSPRLSFNTSTDTSVGKTLATLGAGNLNITDTANSSNTANLNRVVAKVDKELYSSNTGTKVDATLDTRMLSENGQQEIKQQYNDMDENMKAVSDTLPNATSDNKIEAIAGVIWDNIAAYASLGIVPSHGNNGGILGEIPILTGNRDSVQAILQVVSKNAPLYEKSTDSFIPIEQSDAYKQMNDDKQKQVAGLYISKEPITITKENSTYQNGTNGIMNNKGLAVTNVMEQTGMLNQLTNSPDTPVEVTISYNPSRGMIADLLESAVDNTSLGTTGIAKQTGEFVRDVTKERGVDGSNFTFHSQGNIIAKAGVEYVQSTDNKFQTADKFKSTIPNASGGYDGTPTFVSFGSPKNWKDMEELIGKGGIEYKYMGAFTKPGDGVGELLGANKGVNEGSVSPWYRFNPAVIVGEGFLLFSPWSPHSSYDPTNYKELKDVTGYKK